MPQPTWSEMHSKPTPSHGLKEGRVKDRWGANLKILTPGNGDSRASPLLRAPHVAIATKRSVYRSHDWLCDVMCDATQFDSIQI